MKFTRLLLLCSLLLLAGNSYVSGQVMIMESTCGTGTAGSLGDGAGATAAQTNTPYGAAYDASGNLYIAEQGGNKVRKINTVSGIITTIAGTGTAGYSGDNAAAVAATLRAPTGLAVDASGNVFVVDNGNNVIRRIDVATGIITTIAGTGVSGYSGDGAAATLATLYNPRAITLDAAGNIYFSDPGAAFGATSERIRKITYPSGIITTIAGKSGTPGFGGDGAAATLATLNGPRGVAVDAAGNVFIADAGNNRIRKVDAVTNFISTVAGTGTGGFNFDNVAATTAQVNGASGVGFDPAGNLIISDANNNRIRSVNAGTQFITTIAGVGGGGGFAGDGGAATAARINGPVGVYFVNSSMYYIYDRSNNRIRVVYPNHTPVFTAGSHQSLTICQNSGADSLNPNLAVYDIDSNQTETWSTQLAPLHGTLGGAATKSSNPANITPTGLYYTPTFGYSGIDSVIVKVTDGFGTSYDTIVFTITPLPAVAPITGLTAVCVGANITLGDVTTGGLWGATNTNASVGAGGLVTGVTAGIDTVTYSVTNFCGTTTSSYSITVNPLPDAGTIAGPTNVCVGSAIFLSDLALGGAWSVLNATATVAAGNVTGVSPGTNIVSYTVSNSCGTAVASYPITVQTTPTAGTLSGPTSVCETANITLGVTVTGGTWSASNGNAIIVGGVVTGVTAGIDTISYTVTNPCGSATTTYVVTVNPLPVAGSITGPVNVCLGATITLVDAAPGGAWSSTITSVATVAGGVVTGMAVGTSLISYTVINGCGTAVATQVVSVISVPTAGTISGPTAVCEGATITLTDPVSGGSWSALNANATVSSTGVVTGAIGGTDVITYTVVYSCGTAFTTYNITINPLPNPGIIVGSSNVCLGSSTTLTDATPGGVWSATNTHATVSGGVVTAVSAGVDTILYSLTNGCGTTSASKVVTVAPIVTPSLTFSSSIGFTTCPGIAATYTPNPVNGGTAPVYSWSVNGSSIATGASFSYAPATGDVILCSMTSSYACVTTSVASYSVAVVVKPNLTPTASISVGIIGDTVCVGTLITFTPSITNGGTAPTYMWNVNGAFAGSGTTLSYVPSNGDNISLALTSNYLCPVPATVTSNTVTMTVDASETPSVIITASPSNVVCVGTHTTLSAHTIYGGATPFLRWTRNGINVGTGPSFLYTPMNGDVIRCMLASSSSCRTNDSTFSNSVVMTVTPMLVPTVNISTTSSTLVNVGSTVTFIALVGGTTTPGYQWYVNGVAVPGATTSTYTLNSSVAAISDVTCVGSSLDPCNVNVTSNHIIVSVAPLEVNNLATGANLNLVPNPNNGNCSLEGSVSISTKNISVTVVNAIGQEVYTSMIPVDNGQVKAGIILNNELPNGVYLLQAHIGNELKNIRFTINR